MARQGNVVNVTAGSGAAALLQKPLAFDDGRKCRRISFRCALSLTNSSTLVQGTTAFFLACFNSIMGNISLQFGDVNPDVVDSAMPFNQLREMLAAMEGKDVTVNQIPLNQISSNVPVAASTTTVVQLEASRTFVLNRAAQDLTDWCPGATQMRQAQISIQPGTGATPTLTTVSFTTANVQVQVILDDMPAEGQNDVWASVARVKLTATSGTTLQMPIGQGGAIIAVWDEAFVAASSPLTTFDLKADQKLMNGIIGFQQYWQSYLNDLPPSWFDLSTLASVYYALPQWCDPNLMETAEVLVWDQPNNDVTSPKVVVCYIPAISGDVASQISDNIERGQQGQKSTFSLSNLHQVANTNNPPSTGAAASTTPVAIVSPGDTAFSTVSGLVKTPGSLLKPQVPVATVSSVASTVAAAGGTTSAAGSSALVKSTRNVALAIPGFSSPNKSAANSTAAHNSLAGQLLAGINKNLGIANPADGAASVLSKLAPTSK